MTFLTVPILCQYCANTEVLSCANTPVPIPLCIHRGELTQWIWHGGHPVCANWVLAHLETKREGNPKPTRNTNSGYQYGPWGLLPCAIGDTNTSSGEPICVGLPDSDFVYRASEPNSAILTLTAPQSPQARKGRGQGHALEFGSPARGFREQGSDLRFQLSHKREQLSKKMQIVPCTLEEANAFVAEFHRHHGAVVGHKFSIGVVSDDGELCGVAIVGRPVSRVYDNGLTLEVNRCCTNGHQNACSMLYRSAWRATMALGYQRLITYILASETGASLKGAGFRLLVGKRGGGSWSRSNRPRIDKHPTSEKLLFELTV